MRKIGKRSCKKRYMRSGKRICKEEALQDCGTKWKNALCKTVIMLLLVCVSVLNPGNLPEAAAADKISAAEGWSWDAAADQAPYFDGWV